MKKLDCIDKTWFKIFSTTADLRYKLSPALFLNTHFPINAIIGEKNKISENEILEEILFSSKKAGNQPFFIFGSAGSGKSELMRWLLVKIQEKNPERPYIRIARTDLNIFKIVEKFHKFLTDKYFSKQTHKRWEELINKPVTLANNLVWSALMDLLPTDSEILPLSYKIRPLVEENLVKSFNKIINRKNIDSYTDLIHREDFELIKERDVIPLNIDFETFRHLMIKHLTKLLTENIDLVDTMNRISEHVIEEGRGRPILLVDDLVQSLPVYTSDLLDYFITLEKGDWDIVVGITSDSLEGTERGRELLKRIYYLDSIDDRVNKVWLSDETGINSYFLDSSNCLDFIRRYFISLKDLAGYTCGNNCPHYSFCKNISQKLGDRGDPILLPFNSYYIKRIYNSLPRKKGKVRYFIKETGKHLQYYFKEEHFPSKDLSRKISEIYCSYEKERESAIVELYGNPIFEEQGEFQFDTSLADFFSTEPFVKANYYNLQKDKIEEITPIFIDIDDIDENDSEKEAIRDWLEGVKSTLQNIKNMRKRVNRIIKKFFLWDNLRQDGFCPLYILTWKETYQGTSPPMVLEDLDKVKGIFLPKSVGSKYFNYNNLSKDTMIKPNKDIEFVIQDISFYEFLEKGKSERESYFRDFKIKFGLSLQKLSLYLYVIVFYLEGFPENTLPIIKNFFPLFTLFEEISFHSKEKDSDLFFSDEEKKIIVDLFDNFFMIRKDVYAGNSINSLLFSKTPIIILNELLEGDPSGISANFKLDNLNLKNFLIGLYEKLRKINEELDGIKLELKIFYKFLADFFEIDTKAGDPEKILFTLNRHFYYLTEVINLNQSWSNIKYVWKDEYNQGKDLWDELHRKIKSEEVFLYISSSNDPVILRKIMRIFNKFYSLNYIKFIKLLRDSLEKTILKLIKLLIKNENSVNKLDDTERFLASNKDFDTFSLSKLIIILQRLLVKYESVTELEKLEIIEA
jgi:hypothetical protein